MEQHKVKFGSGMANRWIRETTLAVHELYESEGVRANLLW